jgi:hypothetical protein
MHAAQGQKTQAKANFESATQGWQMGDTASPERKTLARLTAMVS